MAKNMHKKLFSEETKLKLDIFRECFPVFIHQIFLDKLYIRFIPNDFEINSLLGQLEPIKFTT